jgi:hypothetical protein
MDTHRNCPEYVSICIFLLSALCMGALVTACGSSTHPTPSASPLSSPTSTLELPTVTPTILVPVEQTLTPLCTDNLTFINDVTIPDGTVVAPGSTLDKQWLVQNSGDCNWDTRYRLRLVSGDALGASIEQALYPARAGAQATLRILFTAPQDAGEYVSEWQAFNADGTAFGESFFIKVEVQ